MALSVDIANSEVGLVPVLMLSVGAASRLCSCAAVPTCEDAQAAGLRWPPRLGSVSEF